MKKSILIILFIVLLCGFTGCTLGFSSVDSLLRAPKLTGKNAAIQTAFENAVGEGVTLQSPRNGAYRSAYVLYDYDGDSEQEVLVFYTSKTDETTVHIHFLDRINGVWISVDDIIGKDSGIFEVNFLDMNRDGVSEILIGYSSKRDIRTFCVYEINALSENQNLSVVPLSSLPYVSYYSIDFDSDGQKEIVCTSLETATETGITGAYVRVLKLYSDKSEHRMEAVSVFELENGINGFASIVSDSRNGQNRVYLDCYYSEARLLVTEIVSWDKENGYLISKRSDSGFLLQTARSDGSLTQDTDGDGVCEIPGLRELPDTEIRFAPDDMNLSVLCRITYHYSEDGELIPVYAVVYEPKERFFVDILSLQLVDSVTVAYDYRFGKLFFYENGENDTTRGTLLFSVWISRTSDTSKTYCSLEPAGKNAGLTQQMIISATHTHSED